MKSTPKVMISEKSYDSLFEVRQRIGLTQKELAFVIGVAPNYLSMIESGKKPFSPKLVKKLELFESNLDGQHKTAPSSISRLTGNQHPQGELREGADIYADCPNCAKKDAEISRLNMIIDKLVSK